jgi:hypothetical protein
MGSHQVKARDIKMTRWANDIRCLLRRALAA